MCWTGMTGRVLVDAYVLGVHGFERGRLGLRFVAYCGVLKRRISCSGL